jgi:hypothetical protein
MVNCLIEDDQVPPWRALSLDACEFRPEPVALCTHMLSLCACAHMVCAVVLSLLKGNAMHMCMYTHVMCITVLPQGTVVPRQS